MLEPYYQDNAVTIYHGDCREILPGLSPVDLVLTDPPYGIDYISRWGSTKFTKVNGDKSVDTEWLSQIKEHQAMFMFSRWDVLQEWREAIELTGVKVRDVLVWDKRAHGAGDPSTAWAPTYELILFASKQPIKFIGARPQNILRHWRVDAGATGISTGRLLCHPNEKPLALLTQIISQYEMTIILDPFMGSGTTLRAAKDLGRKAIGIEIEEKYCEIAAKRMAQEVLQFTA